MTDNRLLTAVSNWLFHYYREGLEEPELLVQIPDVHRHVLTLPIVNEEIGCGGIPQLLANHGMDMLIYGKEAAEAWGLNFYAEALKEAIRRSAADPVTWRKDCMRIWKARFIRRNIRRSIRRRCFA